MIKIKRVQIINYMQFIDSAICIDDGITFLASSNNSGKTELFIRIFGEKTITEKIEKVFQKKTRNINICMSDVKGSLNNG